MLNMSGSCKHLCCHEGVDKPPKAPKNAPAAANNPNEPGPKSDSKKISKQSTVQTKLQLGKPTLAKDTKKIETVDLTTARTSDEYAKVAPRAYRALHDLHEKVNKNNPTPVVSNTKPSFSYKKGDQPTFTFLSQSGTPIKRDEDPSSDYGAGWMDDLPSPTGLLQADNESEIVVKGSGGDHYNLSSPALHSESEDSELDAKVDFGEQQPRAPSITNSLESAIFDNNEYDEAVENLGSVEGQEVSQYFATGPSDHRLEATSSQKLFLSTDSPEKPSSPTNKRKITQSPEATLHKADVVPQAKRGKLEKVTDAGTLQPSSSKENVAPILPVTTVKPEYSDWAAFVAECEEYVEYV